MVRYRVTYKVDDIFDCDWQNIQIIESDSPISRKEISNRLNIDIDKIIRIDVLSI